MKKIEVGHKYGRLTVIKNLHPEDKVVCLCDCGNIKTARADNVFYGRTKSCGCLFNEGNNKKHGDRGTRLYTIWKGIRERCNTPSCISYPRYGGRGIKVCDEWKDYTLFKAWALSHGYDDGLTIDRIDVNGDYEPQNCRWATYKEQARNKRNNHFLSYEGKMLTLAEWSEITGIKIGTLHSRIKSGWTIEKALTTKVL